MLDRDLASLYGVETRALNQAVTRNLDRFPERYSFKLTPEEAEDVRSQIVTLSGESCKWRDKQASAALLSQRPLPRRYGSGDVPWRFATPSRSARGTDRDIPASFLRS